MPKQIRALDTTLDLTDMTEDELHDYVLELLAARLAISNKLLDIIEEAQHRGYVPPNPQTN